MTLIEKARAGRRAALASLENEIENASNVVSIFDFAPTKKSEPIPAFSSIRTEGAVVRLAA
ncbi:hypothetical protein [Maritimibacter sp. UBA3975]|uniref:hypothetical protein n=1 Tax=Maritimibacter sp. UBA3975 TaxID=1946833 RepID=UPI000C0B3854|nr:hypothetical protein [Maritimibacter sp. UBA3975]MAM61974.1 hypothetical protein [Maritimibacter sp.]|tara:strand:- start:4005 stop:4187 length:183 start_codon:yes stop_codon:yes gene_type:complete